MSSINLLHASDLHVSFLSQLRSPLDQYRDLEPGDPEILEVLWYAVRSWQKRISASSYDPQTLEDLAEFIYTNARKKLVDEEEVTETGEEKLDGIILSGDLATTGNPRDIGHFKQFLSADFNPKYPYRRGGGATLSAVRIPIIFLPGNHDRYIPTRRFYGYYPLIFAPGGVEFDQRLMDYRSKPVQRREIVSEDEQLRVVVFCADFTLRTLADHQGRLGWLAQGKVHKDTLDALLSATRNEVQKGLSGNLCILWVVHFPPFYPGIKSHSRLLGEDTLISAANSVGVRAILAGHTHKQLRYANSAMATEVFCCGTTTQYEPLSLMGARHQDDLLEGNHFEILTITTSTKEEPQIIAKQYRYSVATDSGGPRLMEWMEVPKRPASVGRE